MDVEEYLVRKIAELEHEYNDAQAAQENVESRIKKADAKRGIQQGTEYYHKWSDILRNLEAELDKIKNRITAIGVELNEKRHKLEEHRESVKEEGQRIAMLVEQAPLMKPEEWAALSDEDLRAMRDAGAKLPETVLARVPQPSEQSSMKPQQDSPPPTRMSAPTPEVIARAHSTYQQCLLALNKMANGALGAITLNDFRAFVDYYETLDDESSFDGHEKRIKGSVMAAMQKIDSEYVRLLKQWDRLMERRANQ